MNEQLEYRNISNGVSNGVSNGAQTWRIHDRGSGSPVVLIHGFPDSPDVWEPIAHRLVDAGHRVIVPYLRGYHPDTVVADRSYRPGDLGRDGISLLDALDLSSATVIGHDWGATMAYAMAAQDLSRLDALVTIAIPHPTSLKPKPSALWALRHFVHFKAPLAEQRTRRRNFAYMAKMARRIDPLADEDELAVATERIRDLLRDPVVLKAMIDYYRDASPSIDPAYRESWPLPHLLVAGSLEAEILGRETYERSVSAFVPPGEVLIVPDAGHSPHLADPDGFTSAVLALLQLSR